MKDYKDKMEKYVLGYKLIKHLEPKHTYVHWEAPEQFPPVVLPARVVSPHHPILHPGIVPVSAVPSLPVSLPHIVQPVPPRPAPQPALPMQVLPPPVARPPRPQPLLHIDRQDKGHIVVDGGVSGPGGKVKCPYEVYRIRQL